jgi:RNA polymerase sigma-70 factor, ECF subfamily
VRSRRRRDARYATDETELSCEPSVEGDLDLARIRLRLRRALSGLSHEQREVFVLHEIEEMPMHAVARSVGCPLFTAYARNRAARSRIKKMLENAGGEP